MREQLPQPNARPDAWIHPYLSSRGVAGQEQLLTCAETFVPSLPLPLNCNGPGRFHVGGSGGMLSAGHAACTECAGSSHRSGGRRTHGRILIETPVGATQVFSEPVPLTAGTQQPNYLSWTGLRHSHPYWYNSNLISSLYPPPQTSGLGEASLPVGISQSVRAKNDLLKIQALGARPVMQAVRRLPRKH